MTKTVIPNRINWEPYVDVAIGRMIAMFHVKNRVGIQLQEKCYNSFIKPINNG